MDAQPRERETAGTTAGEEKDTVTVAEQTETAVMESLEELRIA